MNTIGANRTSDLSIQKYEAPKRQVEIKSQAQQSVQDAPKAAPEQSKKAESPGVTASISAQALESSRKSYDVAPIKSLKDLDEAVQKVRMSLDSGAGSPYKAGSPASTTYQAPPAAAYEGRFWSDRATPTGTTHNGQGANTSGNENSSSKLNPAVEKLVEDARGAWGVIRRMDSLQSSTAAAAESQSAKPGSGAKAAKPAQPQKPGSGAKAAKPASPAKAPKADNGNDEVKAQPAFVAPRAQRPASPAKAPKDNEVKADNADKGGRPAETPAQDTTDATAVQAQQSTGSTTAATPSGPSDTGAQDDGLTPLRQALKNIGVDLTQINDGAAKDLFGNTVFTVDFQGGLKRNDAPTTVDQSGVMKVSFTVSQQDGNFSVKASTAQDNMQVIIGKGQGTDDYDGQVQAFGQALQFLNEGFVAA